jgi:hypothetical protein
MTNQDKSKAASSTQPQGDYRNDDCTQCGRMRVLLSGICDKCGWNNDLRYWDNPYAPLMEEVEHGQTAVVPLTYEQEVHSILYSSASSMEDLLRYFEAQAKVEKGDAKKLTLKCIENQKYNLQRVRDLIPQALERRERAASPTEERPAERPAQWADCPRCRQKVLAPHECYESVLNEGEREAFELRERYESWLDEWESQPEAAGEPLWDAYRAGAAQKEPGWISVDEQLPEVGGTYLVWAKFAEPFNYGLDLGHFFMFESGPRWMTGGSQAMHVSHWQSFPKAPMASRIGTGKEK